MGPQSNEEYTLYCNGQPVNGIRDFGLEPQNEPDPLDAFLHMEPMEFTLTLAYNYSKMVACMLSPRHGEIYRRTKKHRVRKKYINRCDRIFKERVRDGWL